MKVEFAPDYSLVLVPETSAEAFALQAWGCKHGLGKVWAAYEGEKVRIQIKENSNA